MRSWREACEDNSDSGPKKPYEDECDHDFDEDECAGEYVCVHCGEREPIPLDRIIRE